MTALRCPYCHDALPDDAPDRVACAGCGAAHHAECFVEQNACAATGCGARQVRLGERAVGVLDLAEVARDPERLSALRRVPRRSTWGFPALVFALVLAAIYLFFLINGEPVGLFPVATVAAVAAILVWALQSLSEADATLRVVPGGEKPGTYDAIFGVWRPHDGMVGLMPDGLEAVRDDLREGAAPAAVRARLAARVLPERCPHCDQALAADEDADEEDAALWCCYHCGGPLPVLGPLPDDLGEAPEEEEDPGRVGPAHGVKA